MKQEKLIQDETCHHLAGGPQVLLDDGLLVFIYHNAVVVVVGHLAQGQRLR